MPRHGHFGNAARLLAALISFNMSPAASLASGLTGPTTSQSSPPADAAESETGAAAAFDRARAHIAELAGAVLEVPSEIVRASRIGNFGR